MQTFTHLVFRKVIGRLKRARERSRCLVQEELLWCVEFNTNIGRKVSAFCK